MLSITILLLVPLIIGPSVALYHLLVNQKIEIEKIRLEADQRIKDIRADLDFNMRKIAANFLEQEEAQKAEKQWSRELNDINRYSEDYYMKEAKSIYEM